jgi:hypothetical protein
MSRRPSRQYSIVAAVLDGYGGAPVIVTPRDQLHHHVRPGMIPVIVPDLLVREPIAWDHIPGLLNTVDRYVEWWIKTRNDPEVSNHPAVRLYTLRRMRGYQRDSVNLYDIVET